MATVTVERETERPPLKSVTLTLTQEEAQFMRDLLGEIQWLEEHGLLIPCLLRYAKCRSYAPASASRTSSAPRSEAGKITATNDHPDTDPAASLR